MLPSIWPVPVSGHLKKTQFLMRPFQFSVNEVFRMKAEHFSFKVKVLASLHAACKTVAEGAVERCLQGLRVVKGGGISARKAGQTKSTLHRRIELSSPAFFLTKNEGEKTGLQTAALACPRIFQGVKVNQS